MELFLVKKLDGETTAGGRGFEKKSEAKAERNRLSQDGTKCVVSRGRNHWRGETFPHSGCLSEERTSKRKHRKANLAPSDPVPV